MAETIETRIRDLRIMRGLTQEPVDILPDKEIRDSEKRR